jgi:hypothetical protein
VLALAALLLFAADLTPEKAAKVQRDRDKALEQINKKYGNKKPSELTTDERREMIAEQRAAESAVLEQNGVEAKEMARYEAKMSLSDRAAAKAERERLDKQETEAQKGDPDKPAEIQIQRGFSDSNPVTLEEKTGGPPTVERGLPPDAIDDQNAAGARPADPAPAPAPKAKKGKK